MSSSRQARPVSIFAASSAHRTSPSRTRCRSAGDCADAVALGSSRAPVHDGPPAVAASGDWAPGVYVGEDVCGGGGAFCYDPWELYGRGLLTNPNLAVIGQVGRGKSATVKAYAARSLVFGRRVIALDRKGELARLCEVAGTTPIRLERGGPVRLNPLDTRRSVSAGLPDREVWQDQVDVLIALGGAACRRG